MPDPAHEATEEREGAAWQAIGGLSYTLGELHKRGHLTDYGAARMTEHLDAIRDALAAARGECERLREALRVCVTELDRVMLVYGFDGGVEGARTAGRAALTSPPTEDRGARG